MLKLIADVVKDPRGRAVGMYARVPHLWALHVVPVGITGHDVISAQCDPIYNPEPDAAAPMIRKLTREELKVWELDEGIKVYGCGPYKCSVGGKLTETVTEMEGCVIHTYSKTLIMWAEDATRLLNSLLRFRGWKFVSGPERLLHMHLRTREPVTALDVSPLVVSDFFRP